MEVKEFEAHLASLSEESSPEPEETAQEETPQPSEEQSEEVAEEQAEETEEPEAEEESAEESSEVEASEEAEEEAEAEEPAPAEAATPDGPSESWKATARQAGLPEALIETARDDQQIQQFLALQGNNPPEPEKAEQESEDDLKAKLLVDSLDEDDPIRQQVEHLVEVNNRQAEYLDAVLGFVSSQMESTKQQDEASKTKDFDDALSSMAPDFFGESNPTSKDENWRRRGQAWSTYEALVSANPSADRQELAQRAARATYPDLVEKRAVAAQKKALEKQSKKKTGGKAAPPPAPKPVSKEKQFKDFLSSLGQP